MSVLLCWCQIVLVPNCPVPNCPFLLCWCQIVLVPNCPVPNCPGAKLSWCQIVLVPNCPVPNCPVPNCPTTLPSPREQGDVSTFLCALLVGLLQRERNVCFVAFCFLQVLFKYVSTRGFWLVHSAGICSKAIGNCNRNWPKWSWH